MDPLVRRVVPWPRGSFLAGGGDVLSAGFPGWEPYSRGVPWLRVVPWLGGSLAQGGPGVPMGPKTGGINLSFFDKFHS